MRHKYLKIKIIKIFSFLLTNNNKKETRERVCEAFFFYKEKSQETIFDDESLYNRL
jgi:hypothetical protein